MSEAREAVRHYVQFLREREGLRDVRLTKAARAGLARLVAEQSAAGSPAKAPIPGAAARSGATSATGVGPAQPAARGSVPAAAVARSEKTSAREAQNPAVAGKIVAWPPGDAPMVGALPVETAGGTKAEQLRHLGERAAVCVKCAHLAARRHTVVFGVGNPEARLMFVGEAPGEEEDLQGEPFVGRAGQLLTKMIAAMGLSRGDVYIANIVKCRPDMPPGASGNRKPTRQEMEACVPFLRAQIDIIRPGAMVALGATAVEGLLGPVGTIGSLRGKFLEYRGTPLMPTYHPSYLLRNASIVEKRKVWEDLLKVMERLEMPVSGKQRGFFLKG